jgi:choline-phosphate cytidylyltransferase
MTKVITYGTYDLLHHGHKLLLERAKALGDYLIVGITSDDYDRTRGKINASQSLMERIEAVKALGIADEIIVEEYEGQKIDDIRRLGVDIFTVGSDWVGYFDYLKEYCKVVYLPRTEGVSSSEIRAEQRMLKLGIYGNGRVADKYEAECEFVNGIVCVGKCSDDASYEELLNNCDAVYIQSHPRDHVRHIKQALEAGKHVLCESPIALSREECESLFAFAKAKNLVLMDAIKTAYSTAYNRMLLLIKSGKIGEVMSVDATCTSLMPAYSSVEELENRWNARQAWAPAALLAVFQILGCDYEDCRRTSFYASETSDFDIFTKYDFKYKSAVASVKVGKGVKSEGELIVSGTKGYVYVPAPWWKMDYFEVRYENPFENRRYFYQLDGEGIRKELVEYVKSILRHGGGFVLHNESEKIVICVGEEYGN